MVQLYSYATEFKQNKKFAHFPIGFKTVELGSIGRSFPIGPDQNSLTNTI